MKQKDDGRQEEMCSDRDHEVVDEDEIDWDADDDVDDNDDDVDDNDDDVDDNDDDSNKDFLVLSMKDITKRQEEDISQVSSILGLPSGAASLLLRHFNWNVTTVTDQWFAEEDSVRMAVGLFPGPVVKSATDCSAACRICFDDFDVSRMSAAGCGHFFCNSCWKEYISGSINDGPGCLNLRCPDPSCKAAMGEEMLTLVDEKDRNKYRDYLVRSYVENSKKIKWCPAPDCDSAIEVGENYRVTCGCNYSFCWKCLDEVHSPVDCDIVLRWRMKDKDESQDILWILSNSKPCPKCKKPIEKNQGCMHMTCKPPCSHQFCWLCLGDWSEHGSKTGGFYSCNKYEAGKKEGRFTEEENKRRAAKDSLNRYAHYYERWVANESSRKKSIAQLEEWHDAKEEQLYEVQQVPQGSLKHITEAWVQIIECRRILKWAYAYGYYIPEEEKVKKQFFEFLQGEAEAALERLHHSTEEEVQQFANAKTPSPDFSIYYLKLGHLAKATRTYFENMGRALENGLVEVTSKGGYQEDFADLSVEYDGYWACSRCTLFNDAGRRECDALPSSWS